MRKKFMFNTVIAGKAMTRGTDPHCQQAKNSYPQIAQIEGRALLHNLRTFLFSALRLTMTRVALRHDRALSSRRGAHAVYNKNPAGSGKLRDFGDFIRISEMASQRLPESPYRTFNIRKPVCAGKACGRDVDSSCRNTFAQPARNDIRHNPRKLS
jgi:hypothetical protein